MGRIICRVVAIGSCHFDNKIKKLASSPSATATSKPVQKKLTTHHHQISQRQKRVGLPERLSNEEERQQGEDITSIPPQANKCDEATEA